MSNPDELMKMIAQRRSFGLKQLSTAPIDLAQVERVLEAANWGMSHGKTEPWRFNIYTGEHARRALGEAFVASYHAITPDDKRTPENEQMWRHRPFEAPVWISLGMHRDPHARFPEWEDVVALGTAVGNMHLMASALGLGGKWASSDVLRSESISAYVGISAPSRLFGFFFFGTPIVPEWPHGERTPIGDKVKWFND